jgi:beta-1,4-mannosyl-glycoprotein beta-1,4-N-acetylglucosaminyltransferase
MVYDCFSFFNELDLLEIRLNVLSAVVDKFVLVESDRTHSNEPKPFFFENNKARYGDFLHKIIHIKISEYPRLETSWTLENYQRNMVLEGLRDCGPDDIIIISDLDEIPNPAAITGFRAGKFKKDTIYKLEMKICCYFLNYKNTIPKYWYGSRILRYKNILENEVENYAYSYQDVLIESLNQGSTPTKIRMAAGVPEIKNGGWHFTYLGGLEKIKCKIRSFSHQEFNNKDYLNDAEIEKKLKKGIDFFHPKEYRFIPVKMRFPEFPEYLVVNQAKYPDLIYPDINFLKNSLLMIQTYFYYFCVRMPKKMIKALLKRTRNP